MLTRLLPVLASSVLFAMSFHAETLDAQPAPSLSSLKDKSRVLLVFASTDRDPLFQQQIALLDRHRDAMRERDLVVIPVLVQAGPVNGPDTIRTIHPPVASDADQIDLRHRFHVPAGEFTVILIGKDGGSKLTQHDPVSAEKVEQIIDAMPMRRDEMKSRAQ